MALARNGCAMEIEKGKKILTLSSGIRVESLLVILVRAAAPISRIAQKVCFFEGTVPAIDVNV